MLVHRTVDIAANSRLVLRELEHVSRKDLADTVSAASRDGELILEETGRPCLATEGQGHFGAQLGCQVKVGSFTSLRLHWWNVSARSLTPGFIGEVRVRALPDDMTELSVIGQYYPRALLYELVDPGLLGGMAKTVVSSFVERLRDRISRTRTTTTPALHAVVP